MKKLPKVWVAANTNGGSTPTTVTSKIDMSAEVAGSGKCPECKKPMEIIISGNSRVWACAHDRISLPLPDGYKK